QAYSEQRAFGYWLVAFGLRSSRVAKRRRDRSPAKAVCQPPTTKPFRPMHCLTCQFYVSGRIVASPRSVKEMTKPVEFRQGAIELLILKTLSWGPQHGFSIARWIQDTTNDVLRLEEGSLYPTLHRMEDKGWVKARWGVSENNRRAKFYELTSAG